jgi:D-arabinose 1-dehydrogenase-like Zn-dependent alcohol dehydrogenase
MSIAEVYGVNKFGENLKPFELRRRDLTDFDVQVKILYSGMCHSDKHHVYNDWSDSNFPLVPGHEIIGKVEAIGDKVTQFNIGDAVAIGNMTDSCRICANCQKSAEQYCLNDGPTWVYNSNERITAEGGRTLRPEDGNLGKPANERTFGGYSSRIVAQEAFVFKLPANLSKDDQSLARSAPLLCAGITMYYPLKFWGMGKGHKIGIAGLGGLGHIGVKIASALGAEVVAFTTTEDKVALNLSNVTIHPDVPVPRGVLMKYINRSDEENFKPIVTLEDEIKYKDFIEKQTGLNNDKEVPNSSDGNLNVSDSVLVVANVNDKIKYKGYFDMIIDTVPVSHDLTPYLQMLRPGHSKLHIVGNMNYFPNMKGLHSVFFGRDITTSNVGGLADTKEFLELCSDNNILPDVEVIPMDDNINDYMARMVNKEVRYRYVMDLTQYK